MRRRELITGIFGSAVAWPLAARAQQAARLPTIGFLGTTTTSGWGPWTSAFVQRLHELGWIEGRTFAMEYRWAEGRNERYSELAAELVRLKVDVIFTSGAAVRAAKQTTAVIPIVFVLSVDPIGSGLVASLAHPGGNVTGLSRLARDTGSKRIELLREVVPSLRRLAVMANLGNPNTMLEVREVEQAAGAFTLELTMLDVRERKDVTAGLDALKGRVEALYVVSDPLVLANRVRINTLAVAARLPTSYPYREDVEAGGLMYYGANIPDQFRHAAEYVDKILRGTNPGDIPVEQPTKFDLVINLTTAKALSLMIPEQLLARADEVID